LKKVIKYDQVYAWVGQEAGPRPPRGSDAYANNF
jgi:hypothetical protein